jgi:hypothetical protein
VMSFAISLSNYGVVDQSQHVFFIQIRAAESGFGPPSKGRPAKNIYSKSERLSVAE